jgi:membrane associated rhomboid family serine protease
VLLLQTAYEADRVTSVPPVPGRFEEPPERPVREPILRIPPVTGWLIAINVVIHVIRALLPGKLDDAVVSLLAFWPSDLWHPTIWTLTALVTYQFVHGSWTHLGFNMVTLLAFGPGVERPIGRWRYLIVYLLSGIAGALVQAVFMPGGPDDLMIGASASISGVFGTLLVVWGFHRQGRRPLGILPMVILWSLLMAVTGITGFGADGVPVAWVAHIGGFVAGVALAGLVGRPAWIRLR